MMACILTTALFATLFGAAAVANRMQLARTKKARVSSGASFVTFYSHFSGNGVPERLCRAIYEYLQELNIRDFPVLPEDDLYKVYDIGDDAGTEFDEVVEGVCKKLGITVPSDDEVSAVISEIGIVRRVGDLVRMFARLLKRRSA